MLLSGHYGDALVEQVRVADFGIATLMGQTESQGFYGTPAYMSPERKAYGSSDSSADIYSAGVMLHELLVAPSRWWMRILPFRSAITFPRMCAPSLRIL